MDIVGILLAAGRATRFGGDKRLVAIGNGAAPEQPIALVASRNLCAAIPRVVAVVRRGDGAVAAMLRGTGIEVVECARADEGIGSSLACGVQATSNADAWIVALADMPWIDSATILRVAEALRAGASIAAPFHRGRRGHPVGFSSFHRGALLALSGEEGARRLVEAHRASVVPVEVEDEGVILDVDRPGDLAGRC